MFYLVVFSKKDFVRRKFTKRGERLLQTRKLKSGDMGLFFYNMFRFEITYVFTLRRFLKMLTRRIRRLKKRDLIKLKKQKATKKKKQKIRLAYYKKIKLKKIRPRKIKKYRKRRIWILFKPNSIISKKSKNSRMGKGKGAFIRWCCILRPGQIFIEFSGFSLRAVKIIQLKIQKKFNTNVGFIKHSRMVRPLIVSRFLGSRGNSAHTKFSLYTLK